MGGEVFRLKKSWMFQGKRKVITSRLLADSGLNAYRASELEQKFSFWRIHTDPPVDVTVLIYNHSLTVASIVPPIALPLGKWSHGRVTGWNCNKEGQMLNGEDENLSCRCFLTVGWWPWWLQLGLDSLPKCIWVGPSSHLLSKCVWWVFSWYQQAPNLHTKHNPLASDMSVYLLLAVCNLMFILPATSACVYICCSLFAGVCDYSVFIYLFSHFYSSHIYLDCSAVMHLLWRTVPY